MKRLLICVLLVFSFAISLVYPCCADGFGTTNGYYGYPAWTYCYEGFSTFTKQSIVAVCTQYNNLGHGSLVYSASPFLSYDYFTSGNDVNEVVHTYIGGADSPGLAITYILGNPTYVYEADIAFNTYHALGDASQYSNLYDVPSLALHEYGHLLGLGHSTDENAVMYSALAAGELTRTLTATDIQMVDAIYN